MTSLPGFATSITYQAGGMLHEITHANGVVYTMAINSADGLERPYQISTTAGWDTGTYAYDGAGNIHHIGTASFRYDQYDPFGRVGRLTPPGQRAVTFTYGSGGRPGGS